MSGSLLQTVAIRTLEEDLSDFDKVVVQTGSIKHEITNIAMSALRRVSVDDMDLTNPDSVGNFAKLASTALKAVDAQEVTSTRRVQSKVKLSEVRRSDNVAEVVTDILVKMNSGDYTPEPATPTPSLADESAAVDNKYLELELPDIPDTVLRTNPDDLSP